MIIVIPGSSTSKIEPKRKSDLEVIEKWLLNNRLSCNTFKTCYVTVRYRQNIIEAKDITLRTYDKTVEKRTTTKLPGVYIDETMSWENQISRNITEAQNGLRMLYTIRSLVLRTQEH